MNEQAPRLTPAMIDAVIVSGDFYVFPGTTLTVCCLKLRNGFTVTGESAAASPENFDADIGRKIAYENARSKVWALEGYLLRERLSVTPPTPGPTPTTPVPDTLDDVRRWNFAFETINNMAHNFKIEPIGYMSYLKQMQSAKSLHYKLPTTW